MVTGGHFQIDLNTSDALQKKKKNAFLTGFSQEKLCLLLEGRFFVFKFCKTIESRVATNRRCLPKNSVEKEYKKQSIFIRKGKIEIFFARCGHFC